MENNRPMESPEYEGIRVKLCSDGKYHWTVPVNLLKNPTAYFTVCKIFGIIGGIAFLTANIGPAIRGDFAVIGHELKYWGIAVLAFLLISALAYLIVAAVYKGKYVVKFTMDENGILHEQVEAQAKKAKVLGGVVSATGALRGNPMQAGQGALIAAHTSLSSDFSKVRSIKASPRHFTILVNEPMSKNQVYTAPEDFEFVLNFIKSHCPLVK